MAANMGFLAKTQKMGSTFAGFLKNKCGYPKSSKSLDHSNHSNIGSHGDHWGPHFKNRPSVADIAFFSLKQLQVSPRTGRSPGFHEFDHKTHWIWPHADRPDSCIAGRSSVEVDVDILFELITSLYHDILLGR